MWDTLHGALGRLRPLKQEQAPPLVEVLSSPRAVGSVRVADGYELPALGDVLTFPAPGGQLAYGLADDVVVVRVEGVHEDGHSFAYVVLPPGDVPLGARPWRVDHRRGAYAVRPDARRAAVEPPVEPGFERWQA